MLKLTGVARASEPEPRACAAGSHRMQNRGPKSGQPPGRSEPTPPEQRQGKKQSVAEEDTFGGAERAQKGESVRSPSAKP